MTYTGGPIVTTPKVVSVTFPGDSLESSLDSFGSSLTSSSYWTTITAGLCGSGTCIGAGTGVSTTVSTAPGASYSDSAQGGTSTLQPYLQSLIAAFPSNLQPTADTIYTFYFPATTTITLDGAVSCQYFGAYHNSMTIGTQTVLYAIVPECAPPTQGPTLTLLQETTISASHEILEATTDGVVTNTTGGYYLDFTQQSVLGWNDLGGGELADLCVDLLGLGQDETTENGYTVQRTWSIANATAGTKDPCVPTPAGEVYFNAFPTVSAIIVDVGQSETFTVDALATGTMAAWTVTATDATDSSGQTTYLSFSVAGGTNANNLGYKQMTSGESVQVTVKMLIDPSTMSGSEGWGDGIIVSTNGSNPQTATSGHFWPFIVLTSAEATKYGITMMERLPANWRPEGRKPDVAASRSRVNAAFNRYLSLPR